MLKWICLYYHISIRFCILAYVIKQCCSNTTTSISGSYGKTNDRFNFFSVVGNLLCKIKIYIVICLFIVCITPSNNLIINIR